jgi:hypothetical protein
MLPFVGAALVAAAVVILLIQPVTKGLHASLDRRADELTDTEARKRIALLALRDVEYDFLAGKLDEADYKSLKGELTAEALAALEADEKTRANGGEGVGAAEIEAEITRVRSGLRRGTTCTSCGHANEPDSRFCSSCGQGLQAGAPR